MKDKEEKFIKLMIDSTKILDQYEKESKDREIWRKKQKEEAHKWIKVGIIGVDAGMCWIGDPCYILSLPHTKECEFPDLMKVKPNPKEFGQDWGDFCDKVISQRKDQPATQFNYDAGHPGLGVCVDTGYGDGFYYVYIMKNEEGRVMEAKIVFVEKEENV